MFFPKHWRTLDLNGDLSQKKAVADPTRTGAPTSLAMHDRGLATIISPVNKDSSGKPLTASMKSTIERLRTWDSRSKVNASSDKNLRQALSQLIYVKGQTFSF